MTIALRTCAAVVLLALVPSLAPAQTAPLLRHLELAGGFGVLTGAGLGEQNADLRTVTPGTPFRLFTTTSRLSGAPILDLRAGLALTRRFGVEAHASYGHPELRVSISSDAESAPAVTASERLDEYVIDGGVVVRFDEWSVARWSPFVTVGGGYLRQLHADLVALEEGKVFFAAGGVKRDLVTRPRGWLRAIGARADARINIVSGGIEIEDRARRELAVSGSVYVVF